MLFYWFFNRGLLLIIRCFWEYRMIDCRVILCRACLPGWSDMFEPLPRRQAGEVGLRASRRVATASPGTQIIKLLILPLHFHLRQQLGSTLHIIAKRGRMLITFNYFANSGNTLGSIPQISGNKNHKARTIISTEIIFRKSPALTICFI